MLDKHRPRQGTPCFLFPPRPPLHFHCRSIFPLAQPSVILLPFLSFFFTIHLHHPSRLYFLFLKTRSFHIPSASLHWRISQKAFSLGSRPLVSQPPPTPVWLQSYQISCHHLPKPPFLGTVYNSMRLKPKKKGMQASSQPVLVTILVFDRRQVGARGKQCQRQTAELTSSLLHKQKLHFLTIYFLEVFQILFIQVKFDCILGSIIPPQPTTMKPMGVRLRATEKKILRNLFI